MTESIKKEIFSWIQVIVVAFIIAFFLKTFIFRPVYVKGPSMEPTLSNGQVLFLWKLDYKLGNPDRGDIAVISEEHDEIEHKSLIKRVIALPGDTVEIKNGSVYVNSKKLDPGYVDEETPSLGFDKTVVPEGKYFVLGDNRDNSRDSRDESVGFVEKEHLEGKTIFRFWPIDKFGVIK